MTYHFRAACASLQRDPGHLRLRDRAVLRILNRAQAATAAQLTILAYRNRRLAQARLRRLWDWGYLERIALPPAGSHGGPAFAYRLSIACLRRLGYRRDVRRGPGYLAHTLDAVDAVCALVRCGDPDESPLVQAWLPESIVGDARLGASVPDAIVALTGETGSAVLCLEIDEATQHVGPIRDKLLAYQQALGDRPAWHALFVVPTVGRLAWLRRVAAPTTDRAQMWVVLATELSRSGVDAPVVPVAGPGGSLMLRSLVADSRPRRSAAPVGSRAWLELLGSGGGEELDDVLV
jgi:hypothetical protein